MTPPARGWFAAFVLIVFLAGTSVGVIVDRVWLIARRPAGVGPIALVDGRRPLPNGAAARVVEANLIRLGNRLGLSAEQAGAVRPLLEAWQSRVTELQANTREQLLAETRRFEEELSPLLTPEQRDRLTDARNVLLVPAGRAGRFGGPDEGRGGRGPGRAGPGRPGGPGRE